MRSKERIAKAIATLAIENGLMLDGEAYVNHDGDRYSPTPLGLVPTDYLNYMNMFFDLESDYDEVALSNILLKKQLADVMGDRPVGYKSLAKVKKLLTSNISDREKLKQLSKYFNVKLNGSTDRDKSECDVQPCSGGGAGGCASGHCECHSVSEE